MVKVSLIDTIKVENELGEGVIWDADGASVWWTDIEGCTLYRYTPDTKKLEQYTTPQRLGSFARVANSDYFICGFADGFAYFNPWTSDLQWLQKIDSDNSGTRLNDGRADRQGRFWAGSMVENGDNRRGSLYCLDQELQVSSEVSGLLISNGLCWSPDGSVMYHTDTPSRRIDRYDFNIKSGKIDGKTTFVKTEKGCFPDGSAVDAQGYVWSAQWAASQVVRYNPQGEIDFVLPLSVSQPTCVAFGGPQLDMLFVTSAYQGLGEKARLTQPNAGNLWVFQTNVKGIADPLFRPNLECMPSDVG